MATSKWHRLSEHQVRPTEFLWEQRIPIGAITILEGDPGTGKSTLLADIGGRVTSGTSMPLDSNQRASAGWCYLPAKNRSIGREQLFGSGR